MPSQFGRLCSLMTTESAVIMQSFSLAREDKLTGRIIVIDRWSS